MNILVVDDVAENVELLQDILIGSGFGAVAAGNGKEALVRLQEEKIDAIVSDVLMPIMDGFQLCRECKTNPAWRDIPFIFYTATYTEKKDEDFALSLGADAYIIKPQDPEVFLEIIVSMLTKPELRAAPAAPADGMNDLTYLSEHNQRLIAKLEAKMAELEAANRSLWRSEHQYRLLAENAHDVIFVLDMDLNYTYVSPSVKLLRDYEPSEVIGRPAAATLTRESWELAAAIVAEEIAQEQNGKAGMPRSRTIELEMQRRDGTTVWTEVKVSLLRDENGRPTGILGVTRDITERKRGRDALARSFENLRKALGGTVHAIARVVEIRDPYTAGHQRRVADLSRAIATELGLAIDRIEGLRMAATIHDIGKISVPAEILSKPTRLTAIERSLIEIHPQTGFDILQDIDFPWPVAEMIFQHHERIDGTGYPQGLHGNDILMEARIIAVADVVEAMASYRPYRPALGIDFALEEISRNRGIKYDAEVVQACLTIFRGRGFRLPE